MRVQRRHLAARTAARAARLDRNGIRELQRLLNRLGYNAGPADGAIGSRTRDAIRAFERAQGMEVRGRATDVVLERARCRPRRRSSQDWVGSPGATSRCARRASAGSSPRTRT